MIPYALQLWSSSATLPMSEASAPSAETDGVSFTAAIESTAVDSDREEAYLSHLRSKYGAHFRVESIPRDPEVLKDIGGTMSGDDVIISPIILQKMVDDPETAAYYERTIDHCFETVPEDKAHFAAMGLTFEPCGVVVHDDGTVTYICGGGDSPERVAQVNAINAARDAKRAEQRRLYIESAQENAQRMREMFAEAASAQSARLSATLKMSNHALVGAGASMTGGVFQ